MESFDSVYRLDIRLEKATMEFEQRSKTEGAKNRRLVPKTKKMHISIYMCKVNTLSYNMIIDTYDKWYSIQSKQESTI